MSTLWTYYKNVSKKTVFMDTFCRFVRAVDMNLAFGS